MISHSIEELKKVSIPTPICELRKLLLKCSHRPQMLDFAFCVDLIYDGVTIGLNVIQQVTKIANLFWRNPNFARMALNLI